MKDWCPETLLDVAGLENYYKQITLEEALTTAGWGFPNAIYLNGLDWEGTIRTGNENLLGQTRGNSSYQNTSYSYVDTMLTYNLNLVCSKSDNKYSEECQYIADILLSRRLAHPLQRWDDEQYGRLSNWP